MATKIKSQRQLQMGEQVKRIIADYFSRNGMSIIEGSYVTILEADVSPDAKNCRIFIDIFGNDKNHDNILKKLNNGAPSFRHELGKRLTSRYTPEIIFTLDKTSANALQLEDLLEKESETFSPKPQKTKAVKTTKTASKTKKK